MARDAAEVSQNDACFVFKIMNFALKIMNFALKMMRRYGTMSAADVFAPAIELAEEGFPLTKRGEKFFAGKNLDFY